MSLVSMPQQGMTTVFDWVKTVLAGKSDPTLWTTLDDRLRLTLAQGWVLGTFDTPDDDLAEDLADEDTDNAHFSIMLEYFADRWRSAYADLQGNFGIFDQAYIVGVDMELITLAGEEYIGYVPAGTPIPAHCFVIRFENDDWKIAALARRLPVPGWPPTEKIIPGLEFS